MSVHSELAPVAEDLSSYILAGRVTDASLGLTQATDAERLGFRRVWLSERYSLKESGVLLGGIAAVTTRLGVGTGAMTLAARLPIVTAAMGATLHSAFGPRCVLGLGLGAIEFNQPHGLDVSSYVALTDYADILKRLWRGEVVDYDGPAGTYKGLVFPDTYPGPAPGVWQVQLGGPKACKVAANPAFDGVMLGVSMTPGAVRTSARLIREECERTGRDPASLRICVPVHCAPDVDPGEVIANPSYGGGVVTMGSLKAITAMFLTQPSLSSGIVARNGWDPGVARRITDHPMFAPRDGVTADNRFRNREDIMEVAAMVPDDWIHESCAVGSTAQCVAKLQEFRNAGADEIAIYTSAPAQNAGLIAAWRDRPRA
jgi:probable F420-dependent oxidoreductase